MIDTQARQLLASVPNHFALLDALIKADPAATSDHGHTDLRLGPDDEAASVVLVARVAGGVTRVYIALEFAWDIDEDQERFPAVTLRIKADQPDEPRSGLTYATREWVEAVPTAPHIAELALELARGVARHNARAKADPSRYATSIKRDAP